MNYVQNLILYSVISSTLVFGGMNLFEYYNIYLVKTIELNSKRVEDIARINKIYKTKNILYSKEGFPSSKEGGINELISSIIYKSYYDNINDLRIFTLNDMNIENCYFLYNDKNGKTFLSENCKLTDKIIKETTKIFNIEKDEINE